jgi:hypothetical protein
VVLAYGDVGSVSFGTVSNGGVNTQDSSAAGVNPAKDAANREDAGEFQVPSAILSQGKIKISKISGRSWAARRRKVVREAITRKLLIQT